MEYQWFVGIDWGGESHQVCVLDQHRRRIGERSISHGGEGLAELGAWLNEIVAGEPATMAASIEVPHGAIVDTLLARGLAVFSINPKQIDRFRDRYAVNGGKDDRRDAYVIAASLITDMPAYRRLGTESSFILRMRELSRTADDLDREHRRLCNQLRDLLFRYFPAMLKLSPAADDTWIWDLLAIAPLPSKARRLTLGRIAKILQTHKIRRITADEVQQVLGGEPLSITPATSGAVAEHVCTLLPLLHAFQEQRKHVNDALKELAEDALEHTEEPEHKTVALLRSLPGVGLDISTTLLSEAGRVLADTDGAAFRCYAGIAPVTKQSGKSRRVVMRYGCNHRVRDACYHWARTSVQRDAISRSHYQRLRKAGHCHGRALRGVCDRLISVLMAMLRSGTPYNAEMRLACRVQEAEVHAG